jgi:2-methylfumaryl-CoA isomerase
MVVTLTRRHFQDLVAVTGCGTAVSALAESLGADFGDEGVRYRYRGVLSGLFATWFAERSADEIMAALSATSVLFERYRTFAETAADERVTANPLFSRLHQDGLGDYLAPGLPTVFDGSHFAGAPAPRLGGDTADVLVEGLGLSADDIARLTDAKTIARDKEKDLA